jgi:4-hydroxybenzoate polyprenyltransferase
MCYGRYLLGDGPRPLETAQVGTPPRYCFLALGVGSVALTFVLKQVTDRWMPPLWLCLPVTAFYFLCLIYMFSHDAKQAFST